MVEKPHVYDSQVTAYQFKFNGQGYTCEYYVCAQIFTVLMNVIQPTLSEKGEHFYRVTKLYRIVIERQTILSTQRTQFY